MFCFKTVGRFSVILLVLMAASVANAGKTLMWLVDWYQMGNIDTITTTKSVVIPHYDGAAGYYYDTVDQALTRTNAYTVPIPVHPGYRNDTLPDSLKIPTEVQRNWWALSNFNLSNYQTSRIRIYLTYSGEMHTPMLNRPDPQIQINQYPKGEGQTDQLEGKFVQGCLDSTFGDTVWFWTGAMASGQISSNASSSSIKCLDHNPFLEKVGVVHVLNPWPGKTVYAQVGNRWYPLYQEPDRPGWVFTTLWGDPRNPQDFKIRLANGDPTTSTTTVQYWDAGGLGGNANGTFLDYSTSPGKGKSVWILPPYGGATKPPALTEPPVSMTFYIRRPSWSASAVRVMMKGLDSRFIASSTKYCDWFQINFYAGAVPTNIVFTNPLGDTLYGAKGKMRAPTAFSSFTDWIDISSQAATGGTFSVNTDANAPVISSGVPTTGGLCDTKILAFSAYDFAWPQAKADKYFYEPFSELGYDNNCPGSGNNATKGLVMNALDPVTGMPVLNSSHKAACGIDTKVATNSPALWFDTLWRSGAGAITNNAGAGSTELNKFHCVRVPLKLSGQYYSYENTTFWPLDTATGIPAPYGKPPAGMQDRKFAMHAKAAFEYVPGLKFDFVGDDDVWIFIDKKLALDIGGQHGPIAGTINVDNLGLVEGKSYQFDMFYTERMGEGSSISIKTSMNLVPVIDVQFDTSLSTANVKVIDSRVTETTADASKCPEEGAASVVSTRPGNPAYYLSFPDGTELSIDSAYVVANLPGVSITKNGSSLTADISTLKKSGRLVISGDYQIRAVLGSEERVINFSIVSEVVPMVGVMLDANGDGQPDSVVIRGKEQTTSFKKTASAVVRWADRAGTADSAVIPSAKLNILPGDSLLAGSFQLPLRTECPPTGCTGAMGYVFTYNATDTMRNPVMALEDGIAPVADSAWLVYDTTGTGMDTLYVTASEALVPGLGAALPAGDSAYALTGRTNSHLPVSGVGTIGGNLVKIAINPAFNPIQPGDSIRLGGYSGDAKGNSPRTLSRWVPLTATPVAKSWMLDVDGNGAPDSIGIGVKGSLATATSATVHWKTATGIDTTIVIATPSGIGTGLKLPQGILRNATYCAGCFMEVAMDGTSRRILLLDSVAPVAVSAKLRFGATADTLQVMVSEPFSLGNAVGEGAAALKVVASLDRTGTLVSGAPTANGTLLTIVVDTGAVTADSLRLRGWILGNLNKAVGLVSPFVPLEYGPQPVTVTLFDRNGDGQADSVRFRMARSASGAPVPAAFAVSWAGTTARAVSLTRSADGRSWAGGIGPFPLATACTGSCVGWITTSTNDSLSYRALVEDSVAPVAVSASLRYGLGGQPDTLDVKASENLAKALSGSWVETGANRAAKHGTAIASTVPGVVVDDGIRLIVPSGSIPSNDSIVRLGDHLSDEGGARVGDASLWVVLASAARGQATLLDANQDGAADSIHFEVRGRLGSGSASIVWGDGADGIRSVVVPAGMSTSFGLSLSLPFPVGATSCRASNGCSVILGDGETLLLLDGVAPIAMRARYRFGASTNDPDTLFMNASEPLQARVGAINSWIDWGVPGTSRSAVPFASIALADGRPDSIVVIIPAASVPVITATHAGLAVAPQVRGFSDLVGVVPGTASPMVPLEFGPAPIAAAISDRDGDGRPEGVSIQVLRRAPVAPSVSSFQIAWNDASGAPLTRTVLVGDLVWDAAAGTWSGDFAEPFPYGATACAGICGGSAVEPSGALRPFRALVDSIAPVVVKADFRYSLPEIARDTLVVVLSEAWGTPDANGSRLADAIVSLGSSSTPSPLVNALSWSLGSDGRTLVFVLDPQLTPLGDGDSIRLVGEPLARVQDGSGNRPGIVAPWYPITFGLRPPWLHIGPYPGFAQRNDNDVWVDYPAGTPPLEIFIRPVKGSSTSPVASGPWVSVSGNGGAPDSTKSLGLLLTLNRPVQGYLYIYDNMGIHAASRSLEEIARTWDATGAPDESRQVWINWKGIGPNGKLAPSGVYLFRLVTWRIPDSPKEQKEVINHIFRMGWKP